MAEVVKNWLQRWQKGLYCPYYINKSRQSDSTLSVKKIANASQLNITVEVLDILFYNVQYIIQLYNIISYIVKAVLQYLVLIIYTTSDPT